MEEENLDPFPKHLAMDRQSSDKTETGQCKECEDLEKCHCECKGANVSDY